jgi:GNAT superfamily N-acetyltransferase
MKIRKARLKDVPGIVELWSEFMKEHADIVRRVNPKLRPYTIRRKDAKEEFGSFARKNIRSRNGGVVVAEEDGGLVGYALFFIKKGPSVYTEKVFGYISDLFVKKGFREKRISSLFRDEALKFFRKKGIKHSSLVVSPTNSHARNVYKKWGFHEYHIEMRRRI